MHQNLSVFSREVHQDLLPCGMWKEISGESGFLFEQLEGRREGFTYSNGKVTWVPVWERILVVWA